MQHIFFYFDDSGQLHRNDKAGRFVYAGYVFIGRDELNDAKRKYKSINRVTKQATGRTDEIKAYGLLPKYKRFLYNSMRSYQSLSVSVDISRLYERVLCNKKSICRYKDYALKRIIKAKLIELIRLKKILPCEDTILDISIDEQLTASNGHYSLKESVFEELRNGIVNYDYEKNYPPIFTSNLDVRVAYCVSSVNYMIQASDILANRIWSSYIANNPKWRDIPNHTALTLP